MIATTGANPRSGDNEPDWPTESGAQLVEYAGESETVGTTVTPQYPAYTGYGEIPDRYRNPAGGFDGTDYSNYSFLNGVYTKDSP